jgi:hypothetical protein
VALLENLKNKRIIVFQNRRVDCIDAWFTVVDSPHPPPILPPRVSWLVAFLENLKNKRIIFFIKEIEILKLEISDYKKIRLLLIVLW